MSGILQREALAAFAPLCEERLDALLPLSDPDIDRVTEAMRYSLLGGGKRLRPYLTCLFAELLGGEYAAALDLGCALEMVHTYSLIHDDLPAMDNDDLRRGRPTCHRVYGEAVAILAGDGLLTRAFGVIAQSGLDAAGRADAVCLLSEAAGHLGMIGGQVMDIAAEEGMLSHEKLRKLQEKKTGALIGCACRLGCIASGAAEPALLTSVDRYADRLGLAFQVVDDLLDAVGDEKKLGKPIGSDEKEGKVTFYTLLGEREARAYARRLTEEACEAGREIPGGEALAALAEELLLREL